jgi:hypothetical protein
MHIPFLDNITQCQTSRKWHVLYQRRQLIYDNWGKILIVEKKNYLSPPYRVLSSKWSVPRGYYSMLQTRFGDKASLSLKKSLYGISTAPKLWYEHLLRGLKELGFRHSSYDKCLFYRDDMLLVTFVDNCGLAVKSLDKVDWFVDELGKRGYELHLEGDFTDFLGVTMEPQPDGTIHMHRSGLIKKIIVAAKWKTPILTGLPHPCRPWDQTRMALHTMRNRGNTQALLAC